MDVIVDYRLTGIGWSACTIKMYEQTCDVHASYISDGLGKLVSATNLILAGGSILADGTEAKFSFDDEPAEYRWILSRTGYENLSIKILAFPDHWSGRRPDSEGAVLLQATCPVRLFGKAVLFSLNRILEKHGLRRYKKKWIEDDFPLDGYFALCSSLGSMPSSIAMEKRQSLTAGANSSPGLLRLRTQSGFSIALRKVNSDSDPGNVRVFVECPLDQVAAVKGLMPYLLIGPEPVGVELSPFDASGEAQRVLPSDVEVVAPIVFGVAGREELTLREEI